MPLGFAKFAGLDQSIITSAVSISHRDRVSSTSGTSYHILNVISDPTSSTHALHKIVYGGGSIALHNEGSIVVGGGNDLHGYMPLDSGTYRMIIKDVTSSDSSSTVTFSHDDPPYTATWTVSEKFSKNDALLITESHTLSVTIGIGISIDGGGGPSALNYYIPHATLNCRLDGPADAHTSIPVVSIDSITNFTNGPTSILGTNFPMVLGTFTVPTAQEVYDANGVVTTLGVDGAATSINAGLVASLNYPSAGIYNKAAKIFVDFIKM